MDNNHNKKRILLLENILIPLAEQALENTNNRDCEYMRRKMRVDELKLEYFERKGESYRGSQ